jgi:hypothetical protein
MFPSPFFALVAAFLFLLTIALKTFLRPASQAKAFTSSLPWIGAGNGSLSWLKAIFRSITKSEEMVQEGYSPVRANDIQ